MAHILGTENVEFLGRVREYEVWSSNLEGAPKCFISYNAGRPFISAEVPPKFRGPMVLHELYEFEVSIPTKIQSPCLEALKFELSQVFEEEIDEYAKFRLGVLEGLVRFQNNHNNQNLAIEIAKSRDYIKELLE